MTERPVRSSPQYGFVLAAETYGRRLTLRNLANRRKGLTLNRHRRLGDPAFTQSNKEVFNMNKFKLALAALAAVSAAAVAAPEPAKAQGFAVSVGFGGPAYYGGGWGYGYRPIRYGYGPGWGYGYRRPFVRRVVHRPYYPAY